ncbi:MAG: hypothetical protein HYZ89_01095 [Candidatus Omnitrophica bacterium]|nr:hypothetical protein [Candidatus Omnitrophota bacterium]
MFRTSSLLARNGRSRRLHPLPRAARPKSRPARRFAFEPLEERTLLSGVEGAELWSFSNASIDRINDIAPDTTTGKTYVVGGFNFNTVWKVARLNADGTLDAFLPDSNGPGDDYAKSVVTGPDGSVYVAGAAYNLVSSKSKSDFVVRKYAPSGSLAWERAVHGDDGDAAVAIAGQMEAGTFYVYVAGRVSKAYLTKYDANGNTPASWPKRFTGDAVSVTTDSAGNIYVGAAKTVFKGGTYVHSALISKYNPAGGTLGTVEYSSPGSNGTILATGYFNGVEYLWDLPRMRYGATPVYPNTVLKRNLSDLSVNPTGGCHAITIDSGEQAQPLDLKIDTRGGVDNLYVTGDSSLGTWLRQFHMNTDNTCSEDTANWAKIGPAGSSLAIDAVGDVYVTGPGAGVWVATKFQGPASAGSKASTASAGTAALMTSLAVASAPPSATQATNPDLLPYQPPAIASASGGNVTAQAVPPPAPASPSPTSANRVDQALADFHADSLDDATLPATTTAAEGTEVWSFTDSTTFRFVYDVAHDSASGKTFLVGESPTFLWKVMRLNADGTLDQVYQDPAPSSSGPSDAAHSVVVGPDGSIYVAGKRFGVVSRFSSDDFVVIKYNTSGNIVWEKKIDGFKQRESAVEITGQVESGAFYTYVVGNIGTSKLYVRKGYITKLDVNGNVMPGWPKTFSISGNQSNAGATSVTTDSAGMVYVGGWQTGCTGCGTDFNVIQKYNPSGALVASVQYPTVYPQYGSTVRPVFFNGTQYLYELVYETNTITKRNLSDLSVNPTGGCHGIVIDAGPSPSPNDFIGDTRGGVDNLYFVGSRYNVTLDAFEGWVKQFHMNSDNTCVEDTANWAKTTTATLSRVALDSLGNVYVSGPSGLAKKYQGPSSTIAAGTSSNVSSSSTLLSGKSDGTATIDLGPPPYQPPALVSASGGNVTAQAVPPPASPSPTSANRVDQALAELSFGLLDDALLTDLALAIA